MNHPHWREDTPAATATPTQARLAREHAERMKRLDAVKPRPAVVQPPAPEPAPAATPAPANSLLGPPAEPKPTVPDLIARWLDHWRASIPPTMTTVRLWRLIQQVTAEQFGMTRAQMLSRSRQRNRVRARQVSMFLCLDMIPSASLPEVGRWFDRDHTTVIHSRDVIRERIAAQSTFAEEVDKIRQAIRDADAKAKATKPQ